jgi:hypothetical protein
MRVTGRTGTLAKILVDIAEPAKPVASAAAPTQTDALAAVMERMASMQERILERLSAPPPPAAPPVTMDNMLDTMITLRTVFAPPPAAPAVGIVEMAAQMRALKSLGEEFAPPAPPDADNPLTLANGLLGVLTEAMKSRTAPQSIPTQDFPPVQLPATMNTPPDDTGPETTADQLARMTFEGLGAAVMDHATQGKPHAECAAFLAEALPDDLLPMLKLVAPTAKALQSGKRVPNGGALGFCAGGDLGGGERGGCGLDAAAGGEARVRVKLQRGIHIQAGVVVAIQGVT